MAASYQYQQYQQYQPQQPQQQAVQQQAQYHQSYQQAQQYQQAAANGQYGYQQQYQQYSQQQVPQQQSPTQQYSPQTYQQQYSNQQYPQQQVSHSQFVNPNYAYSGQPTQQYPVTHQGSYQEQQGSYAQQTAQTPTQTSAQSCFNCGVLGHFAQVCPEPKRQVPAGALNPEQHRRQGIAPFKRGGQIVTKFTPQGQVSQGSPSAYTSAYSAGGYPQYPPSHAQTYTPSYTPTTPQSAPSPAQSWPQHGQQYSQYHQGYQNVQNNGYYQASPSQQQSWPVSGTPVSGAPYGAPNASQASPTHSQIGQPTQTPYSLHGQGWGTPARSIQQSPTPSQHFESANEKLFQQQNSPEDQSNPLGTKLFSPKSPPEIDEDVDLEDDLSLLDVPDLPPSTAQYGDSVVTLICMPVPSNFIVADALFPMDPPASETEGRCYSKYLRNVREDVLLQSIKQSVYWSHQGEDPVFRNIVMEDDVIPVDDCLSQVMQRRKPQEQLTRDGCSESRSAAPSKTDSFDTAASLQKLEKALAKAKADIANREKKQRGKKSLPNCDPDEREEPLKHESSIKVELLSPSEYANMEDHQGRENEAEDVLASLGVTGTAKPVGPPTRLVSQSISTPIETKSRSDSVSKAESTERYNSQPRSEVPQIYQYPPEHVQDQRKSQPHDVSPSASHQNSRGHPELTNGTAGNSYPANTNMSSYGANGAENMSGNYQYQSDHQFQQSYPNRSASSVNRKRAYEERSSSEESEEEARRQEDDITPRLKRRQPKVAEAYSRRW